MSGNKSIQQQQQQSFPPACRSINGTFSPQSTMFVQANGHTYQLVNIPQSANGTPMRFVTPVVNPVVSGNLTSAIASPNTGTLQNRQGTIQTRQGTPAIIRYVTTVNNNNSRLQLPLPIGARALTPAAAGQLASLAPTSRPSNATGQPTIIRGLSPQVSASQQQQHIDASNSPTTIQTTTNTTTQSTQLVRRAIPLSTAGPRPSTTMIASGIQHQAHTIASPLLTTRPQGANMRTAAISLPSQLAVIRGVPQQLINSQTPGIALQAHTPGAATTYGATTTTATPQPSATAPSQMRPEEALNKCSSFLSTLLLQCRASGNFSKQVYTNVQNLVQSLIDGRIQPIEFTDMLQKELGSEPQTALAPFLTRALPLLRQSMMNGETTIQDIRPPNQPPPSPSPLQSPIKIIQTDLTAQQKKKKSPLPPGAKTKYAIAKEKKEARLKEKMEKQANEDKLEKQIKQEKLDKNEKQEKQEKLDKIDNKEKQQKKQDKQKRQDKQKKQEKQLESFSSALREDDDVNDVAAMGGVNLAEESQRIMASGSEHIGTQIRSCKDEPFLETKPLFSRIAALAIKNNLSEPSAEVVALISHAVQERLKNLVERLGVFAEHRCENLKLNPRYEVAQDVRGQIKFLAELDRIEKRRHEEQERELLLRAAKSRSKLEDPEQLKLRQKAKEMQRAEQEEARQREANETALLAIGPRKKMKPNNGLTSSISTNQQNDSKNIQMSSNEPFRRVKRVNMRDLQFLLEHERAQLNRLMRLSV